MQPVPESQPLETQLVSTGLRLFFLAASIATGLQIALSGNADELALQNLIAPADRKLLIAVSLAAGLCASMLGALYVALGRSGRALMRLRRATLLFTPLLLSAAIPSVFSWNSYQNREFLFAVVATLFALGLEQCFRTSVATAFDMGLLPRAPRLSQLVRFRPRRTRGLAANAPPIVLGLMILSFTAYMIVCTVQQHYQLKTYSWDLGIFDNLMYNLLRGHWFKASPVLGAEGSHLQFHATFGAYLLLPVYALWQKAETLIALQATLVGAGAIPLYLLAKLRLESGWLGVLFAFVYLVHAPLHGPLFYDFHFLTISVVFVLTVIYCFEAGAKSGLIISWLIAISMREEVSATLGVCALYYLLTGKRTRWAFWGGLLCAVYFLVTKFIVMPAHGQAGQSFSWIFKDLIAPGDAGFGGVLRTLATSPVFAFSKVFTADKFEYLLRNLGPVLLLVVRGKLVWILCLPAFIFTLLSTGYEPMIQTGFQYTANWTPYVMAGSIFVLDAWRRSPDGLVRFWAAIPALGVAAMLFSYNFGAIFQRNSFVGGFHKVEFEYTKAHARTYSDLKKLIDQIPPRASVAACELLVPHVSNRENAFTLNRSGTAGADYLLCQVDWLRRRPVRGFIQTALKDGSYSFVGRSGAFAMWKKGGNHEKDAEGVRLVHPELGTKLLPMGGS